MGQLAIDHVVIPVGDLASAASVLESKYGLMSVEGGRHPGWGTANRIVPLGDAYLELVTVVDGDAARKSPFGRWVLGAKTGAPLGWAVRTDAIEEVAVRLGLPVSDGSRTTPDGRVVRWRTVGLQQATTEPALPFFIEWGDPAAVPWRAPVSHPSGDVRILGVGLSEDAARIRDWLAENDLPLSVTPGPSGVTAVLVGDDDREFDVRI